MPDLVSTGQITIVDLNDGVSAALEPRSAIVVLTGPDGVVSSYAGMNATMKVYVGGLDDTENWTIYVSAIGAGIKYADDNDASPRTGTGAVNGLLDWTPGYIEVRELTVDTTFIEITAEKSGYSQIKRQLSVARVRSGQRGSVAAYISGRTSWSDQVADDYFTAYYGGTKVLNDVVTQYGTGFSQTRFWNGTAWVQVQVAIDGNLLVSGTVGADKITATSLAAITATLGNVSGGVFYGGSFSAAWSWPTTNFGGFHVSSSGIRIGTYNGTTGTRIELNANGTATFDNAYVRGNVEATSLKVDSANIVNTLHLAGNAVTIPVSARFTDSRADGLYFYDPGSGYL